MSTVQELKHEAKRKRIDGYSKMRKDLYNNVF